MAAWRYEISLLMYNIFQHSKINFVSPRDHAIFCIPLSALGYGQQYSYYGVISFNLLYEVQKSATCLHCEFFVRLALKAEQLDKFLNDRFDPARKRNCLGQVIKINPFSVVP